MEKMQEALSMSRKQVLPTCAPMTPEMVAQHLVTLQSESTLPLTKPPLQKHHRIRQTVIYSLLIIGVIATSIVLFQMGIDWYIISIPVFLLLLIGGISNRHISSWIGFKGKTLDWLTIILEICTLVITTNIAVQQTTAMRQQNHLADEQLKNQILQDYTDAIQGLLLDRGLLNSKQGDRDQKIATTRTTLALRQLDAGRKAQLLRFIYQTGLVSTDHSIINLGGADLRDVDLSGDKLSGVDLSYADLGGADLNGSILSNASLRAANLSSVNLSFASLDDANLSFATLDDANLSGTNLAGADLSSAHLGGADLGKAILFSADLSGADLSGADLSNANLVDADLRGANLTGANLRGADLSRANLTGAVMPDGSKHS